MKRIAFHPAARAELLEAAERYEEQASGLGLGRLGPAADEQQHHADQESLGLHWSFFRWDEQRNDDRYERSPVQDPQCFF